jgi:hypothetical protein
MPHALQLSMQMLTHTENTHWHGMANQGVVEYTASG